MSFISLGIKQDIDILMKQNGIVDMFDLGW